MVPEMQRKILKNTDIEISEICLGLSLIGAESSENDAFEMLDHFLDAGGNLLDTARFYANWIPGENGRSERILGDYLRKRGNRDKFVICTKGCHPHWESMSQKRVNPLAYEEDLNASLKALGTDHIDLYLLHRDDPAVPVEVLLEAMENARRSGKIREYGLSNWKSARIRELSDAAAARQYRGIRVDQELINYGCMSHNPPWDPDTEAWDHTYPDVLRQADCAIMAYSGQAAGFFHKVNAGEDPAKAGEYYNTPENIRRAAALQELSLESGLSISSLLLKYLLQAKTLQIIPIVRGVDRKQLELILETLDDTVIDFGSLRDFE